MSTPAHHLDHLCKFTILANELLEQQVGASPLLSPAEIKLARTTCDTLLRLRSRNHLSVAAILARLVGTDTFREDVLRAQFGSEATDLAIRFSSWLRTDGVSLGWSTDPTPAMLSHSLRQLLRSLYLDAPELPLISLIIADHHARLNSSLAGRSLAKSSQDIFIPLAEMLGLWAVRRNWLTRSYQLIAPERYNNVESRLLLRGEDDKVAAFDAIRGDFLSVWHVHIGTIPPRIARATESIGSLLLREDNGESNDDLPARVAIRIFCRSVDECYRMLGIVHSLGRPVTTRYSERFDDYIASPKPNGYQALHTSLMYTYTRSDGRRASLLVKVRILTSRMHHLNELGALAALETKSLNSATSTLMAWWNQGDAAGQNSNDSSEVSRTRLRELIGRHDLGSFSPTIYAFTPAGRAISLPQNSTALDFAYYVHTEVGHHAARIQVNGLIVPYGHRLQNGDLVRVRHEPHFSGPDLSWLRFINTNLARDRVRKGLHRRAQQISVGRVLVERALIRQIDYYREQKHYDLELSSQSLDAFLFRIARLRSLPDIRSLYEHIASQHISAEKLARNLVSQVLSTALVSSSGEPIKYPLHRIVLCDICRPIPGEQIVVMERRAGTSARGLVIHLRDCKAVAKAARESSAPPMRWSETDKSDAMLVEYNLSAGNRYRVLGDILDVVYSEQGVNLYKVEAQAYNERPASIVATLGVSNAEQISHLHSQFELIKGVAQVFSMPVAHGEKVLFTSSQIVRGANPYDESAVFQRFAFYDREEQASRVEAWLGESAPTQVMILHGQRRVGKSALARYLIREIVPQTRRAIAAYIDLQGLSKFAPDNVARYLAASVYDVLGSTPPTQEVWEEPVIWLNRVLREAVDRLGETRLLIILDEFNYLIELEQDGLVDPVIFYNLRAVVTERRDVNWLMIVQDVHFQDTSIWGSAGPLMQQAISLNVPNLDSHWARKLIVEPASLAGFTYQGQNDVDRSKDVAAATFDLTAGNPYFIHALCRRMIDQAIRQRRTNITMGDLKMASGLVLRDGTRYFDHFRRALTEASVRAVLKSVVRNSAPPDRWARESQIVRELAKEKHPVRPKEIGGIIARLSRVGVLETRTEEGQVEVSVAVPLFHQWVSIYLG